VCVPPGTALEAFAQRSNTFKKNKKNKAKQNKTKIQHIAL